jgi:hypothetical protein
MRNVILVLGMHRSGTSAAAGFMVKLGGAQPKTLLPADDGNERGYFESQALMTFHDELLASAGSSWSDWRQFNPAWYQSPTATTFRKRAKQLFKEEFDGEPLAVLKDPRVCRFVPSGSRFWLALKLGRVSSFRLARRSKSRFPCGSGTVSRSPQGRCFGCATLSTPKPRAARFPVLFSPGISFCGIGAA